MTDFLSELKKLDAEATPGKWNEGGTDDWITIFKDYSAVARIKNKIKGTPVTPEDWANAELIVLLRNNVPALIELVEAAEEVIEYCHHNKLYEALSKLKGDV